MIFEYRFTPKNYHEPTRERLFADKLPCPEDIWKTDELIAYIEQKLSGNKQKIDLSPDFLNQDLFKVTCLVVKIGQKEETLYCEIRGIKKNIYFRPLALVA